jgi:hypothetical protein
VAHPSLSDMYGCYLGKQWLQALDRAKGLPASSASVKLIASVSTGTVVYIPDPHINDNEPNDSPDHSNNGEDTSKSGGYRVLIAPVLLRPFVAGRDGKVCLYSNDVSMTCMIRPDMNFELYFPFGRARDSGDSGGSCVGDSGGGSGVGDSGGGVDSGGSCVGDGSGVGDASGVSTVTPLESNDGVDGASSSIKTSSYGGHEIMVFDIQLVIHSNMFADPVHTSNTLRLKMVQCRNGNDVHNGDAKMLKNCYYGSNSHVKLEQVSVDGIHVAIAEKYLSRENITVTVPYH